MGIQCFVFSLNPTELHLPGDALMLSLLFGGNCRDGRNAGETQARKAEWLGALTSWPRQLKAYRSLVKDQLLEIMASQI